MPSPRRHHATPSQQYRNNSAQTGVPLAQAQRTTTAGQGPTPAIAQSAAEARFRSYPQSTQPQQYQRPHPAMPPTTAVPSSSARRNATSSAGIRKSTPSPAQKAVKLSSLNVAAFQSSADQLAAARTDALVPNLRIPEPRRRDTAPAHNVMPTSVTEPVRRRSTLPNNPAGSSVGVGPPQGEQFVNLAQLDKRRMQSPPVSMAVAQKRPPSLTSQAANFTPTARSPAAHPASTAMPRFSGTPYQMLRSGELNNATKENLLVGLFLARGFPTDDAISRLAGGDEAIADIVRNAANRAVLRISDKWAQETE